MLGKQIQRVTRGRGNQSSDSEENSDDEISAGDMHIFDLAGGLPSGSYVPSSLPLHTTVSDKLKKKIGH